MGTGGIVGKTELQSPLSELGGMDAKSIESVELAVPMLDTLCPQNDR
jgi:hypothetical protein